MRLVHRGGHQEYLAMMDSWLANIEEFYRAAGRWSFDLNNTYLQIYWSGWLIGSLLTSAWSSTWHRPEIPRWLDALLLSGLCLMWHLFLPVGLVIILLCGFGQLLHLTGKIIAAPFQYKIVRKTK
jgi:hypothetical protein